MPLLLILSGILGLLSQNSFISFVATAAAHSAGYSSTHPTPNRFNPRSDATSISHPGFGRHTSANAKVGPPQSLRRLTSFSMKPGKLSLAANRATVFKGSDGRLEIDAPASAITSADLAAAGGAINLRISQIAPASGSSAGGSGMISFGTYLVQLVDAHGVLLSHGLGRPLTFKLHYGTHESALDLSNAFVVVNGSLPDGTSLAPLGAAPPTRANSGFGSFGSHPATLDTRNHTLIVQYTLGTPSGSMTWNTDAPVATFGKPDPFNVDLNAGALTSSLPIDVPSGPGGLTPPINLTYSSAGVSEQHSPQGAAGWVGEGWNLDLGAISWAEHNSNASCTSGCGNGWEDTWQLSDPFGTGAELIPPNINVSTFFDDTVNNYCGADGNANNATSYPCPIRWHTTPENYAKVYAYIGPLSLPDGANAHPPCFRVWLSNGIMEEFGCTADSVEYYYTPGMGDYISSWKLDLITDPQGNQIHITYKQDVEQKSVSGVNHQYIRDSVLNTIEWDSPSCHNAQTMCTGSSWAPLVRVNFLASHVPSRLTNSPSGCNSGANLRCDDPNDLSGSNGLAAPDVQSTFALNDVQVQARTSGSAGWSSLKDYQFSYQMSGPSQITDPSTGKAESAAGSLLMTQYVEAGTDATTALMYSGMDNSSASSYAYLKTLDVSAQNLVVSSNTTLSYWIFPQSSTTNGSVSGNNSTCVAIDMIFSDGSDLRDSGAVDQNGNRVHPAYQCGHLKLDQWNLVTSHIGANVNGKTINHIDVGYDQPGNTGGFRGYVDNISLTNGSTTLFSTSFESGQQQPAWTNAVDSGFGSEGGINNVGGFCCSLTGPELGIRAEIAQPTTAMPARTFGYSSVTQYYEDDVYHPNPTTNCGPSWNTGNGSGCLLWSQSYAANSWYLSSASNGMGLQQTFTWDNARDNSHGVNGGGGNNADPRYCNAHPSGYPCNEADDQNWSHAILTQQEGDVIRSTSTGNTTVQSIAQYAYQLTYPLPAQECSDCVAGMYWGNQNNGDYLDYYDAKYMGFAEADVTNPDGSITKHHYDATEGYGLYDASVPCLAYIKPCRVAPWWDITNVAHGHETETDFYDTNGTSLLKKVTNQYQAVCPPSGVSGTPSWSTTLNGSPYTYTWDGKLVAELDHGNPVVACDVQNSRTDEYTYDGSGSNIDKTTTYNYDSLGRRTQSTVTSSDGGTAGDPTTVVTHTDYIQNDAVSATSTSATGTYLMDIPADTIVEDSGNTTHYSCTYTGYDGHGWATGQQSGLTLGEATSKDQYTSCGTSGNSGLIRTAYTYDASGNQITSSDPDAIAGDSTHLGCTSGSATYSTCTTFDSVFQALPISMANAKNQTTQSGYSTGSPAPNNGFGLWQMSSTDANGQATNYTYDALGRMTSETRPNEGAGLTTTGWSYTAWCGATGAQAPCLEVDQTQRLDSSNTVTSRAFYDGYGNLVETRQAAPGGYDVVRYRYYDPSRHDIFDSISYLVPAYSGGPGAAAFSQPDVNQPGTTTAYDGADRVTSVKDALSNTTTTNSLLECGAVNDSGCYEQTNTIDAKGHLQAALTDALGRKLYALVYTGNSSSTYAIYTTIPFVYDATGNVVKVTQPNGSATTMSYDAAGHKTGITDPDRGTQTFHYDADGNLTQVTDARNSSTYTGYDGVDRQVWRNSSNTATGAYITYSYDDTTSGNNGVGRVTGETFKSPNDSTLSGSYAYTYDARGQVIASTSVILGTTYTTHATYDDSGNQTSLTYPDGETVTDGYTAQGWLGQVSTSQGNTTLLSAAVYSGTGGAAQMMTSANLGNSTYRLSATYDALVHLTDTQFTRLSDNVKLFDESRTFDPVNNVTAISTTLPAGTDNQVFCYDDLNRLTWSGTTTGNPCGNAGATGTFTGASYTQAFSYDTLNRLTAGPLGSYTYGDAAHLHAATQVGTGSTAYTATYDAAGDMACRAPDGSTTCSGGTTTGQQLTWDSDGRLAAWQNTPNSPTNTAGYLYDGEGKRVAQRTASINSNNTTTTTTTYLGSLEEISSSVCTGSFCPGIATGPQTTTYYYASGKLLAEAVNGSFSYLVTNAQGTPLETLDITAHVTASRLYAPYGAARYSSGSFPTSYGFTGQRNDTSSGLDYYGARYYDPILGQFVSADPAGDGLNIFAYVHGNPETLTDPSGLWTGAICISGSAGLALGGFIEGCIAIGQSANGDWSGGLTGTIGGGGYAGVGVGGAVTAQGSNANSVDDLGGPFTYLGGGGAVGPVGVTGTGFAGKDSKGRTVLGGEGGWQTGLDADVHGGESVTGVLDFSTIGNWFSQKAGGATNWVGQQLGRAKDWAGRQLGNVVNRTRQQVGNALNQVRRQVSNATSWVGQGFRRAETWFDREYRGFQDWAGQQVSNATSWVNQQFSNASSWVDQQMGGLRNWFGL